MQSRHSLRGSHRHTDSGDDDINHLYQIKSNNDELDYNVQNKTKLKIINNEYIDLGILLSKPIDPDETAKNIVVKNGSLVITP